MSQQDYPTDFVLKSLEAIMSVEKKQPKVLMFDIGGVCVVSPFQAILDYELTHKIPPGWVNYSISKTSPNGAWHKLERGEILMNADFFTAFNRDLRDPGRWKEFYTQAMQKQNIEVDEKTIPSVPKIDGEWLFFEMMGASRAPDPWMAPALLNLKKSGKYLLAALSNTVIFPPDHEYSHSGYSHFILNPRTMFDVFISSAHVGLRKPSPEIYKLALREVNKFAKEHAETTGKGLGWDEGIKPEDILFLDDIGENLKAAKKAGFGTIKVHLGRAFEAVAVLEEITGLKLAGNHAKIPVMPRAKL